MTAAGSSVRQPGRTQIALVGAPNVGKSATFNAITGRYVTVSNYPGTTVEVARGRGQLAGANVDVVDTPGMYGLLPITEEEGVAREILLGEEPHAVVQVVDAKNLERMLPLTLQLIELRLPLVVALNMIDEAESEGVYVDAEGLAEELGVPVVRTVATESRGLEHLGRAVERVAGLRSGEAVPVEYDAETEERVAETADRLRARYEAHARAMALLELQADSPAGADASYRIASRRHEVASAIVARHVRTSGSSRRRIADWIETRLISPVTGIPLLLLVLYFGLYQFVGVFGAGTVVDFLEADLFGARLLPWFEGHVQAALPAPEGWQYWARELVVGDYGIITLGVTYAIAIVLPIVCLFFLFFSVLEDSGYFPRLALLVDRTFKRLGLNGRAVIPVVLGFACDTMATMVTRVQESRRERVVTTALLALAVPCSAQYGVIAAMLASRGSASPLGMSWAFLVWAAIVALVFLASGVTVSKVVSGRAASFHMELPPLRPPRIGNVLVKTYARMKWYLLEVLPLFVLASVLIWVGRITGLFDLIIAGLEPVVGLLGLPTDTAPAFLYGFFRRDFGAAGLFDMAAAGTLTTGQTLVACVTLTLFLPCIAQLLIMHKERGLRTAVVMAGAAVVVAFCVGGGLRAAIALAGGWQ